MVCSALTHLNLFTLEDIADARVEGSPWEHGCDRIGQIQNFFKHWCHFLKKKKKVKILPWKRVVLWSNKSWSFTFELNSTSCILPYDIAAVKQRLYTSFAFQRHIFYTIWFPGYDPGFINPSSTTWAILNQAALDILLYCYFQGTISK